MSDFFHRPAPKQSVPGDLSGLRGSILNVLSGVGGKQGGALGGLQGLADANTPGGDVLGPLKAVSDQNLQDNIAGLNASSPGRFSSANLYAQGQLRQRSMNDFNLLGSQVLEHGRDRQLQAIMAILGPALGPTFGGPFTQGQSGFGNLLGGIDSIANLLGALKGGSGSGGGHSTQNGGFGGAGYGGLT